MCSLSVQCCVLCKWPFAATEQLHYRSACTALRTESARTWVCACSSAESDTSFVRQILHVTSVVLLDCLAGVHTTRAWWLVASCRCFRLCDTQLPASTTNSFPPKQFRESKQESCSVLCRQVKRFSAFGPNHYLWGHADTWKKKAGRCVTFETFFAWIHGCKSNIRFTVSQVILAVQ